MLARTIARITIIIFAYNNNIPNAHTFGSYRLCVGGIIKFKESRNCQVCELLNILQLVLYHPHWI